MMRKHWVDQKLCFWSAGNNDNNNNNNVSVCINSTAVNTIDIAVVTSVISVVKIQ